MATYNGHKNWNHWNVSLWVNNDEGLYRLAQDCLRDAKRHGSNRDQAARWMLNKLPNKTPDGAPYSFSSVRAAMRGMEV